MQNQPGQQGISGLGEIIFHALAVRVTNHLCNILGIGNGVIGINPHFCQRIPFSKGKGFIGRIKLKNVMM